MGDSQTYCCNVKWEINTHCKRSRKKEGTIPESKIVVLFTIYLTVLTLETKTGNPRSLLVK